MSSSWDNVDFQPVLPKSSRRDQQKEQKKSDFKPQKDDKMNQQRFQNLFTKSTNEEQYVYEKKNIFKNEDQDQMINTANQSISPIYINLWNVESSVTQKDIQEHFQELNIKEIMKNQHKQGNFDCIFSSRQDAIQFIKHGTGKIKERSFFMRMSYRNSQNNESKHEDTTKSKQDQPSDNEDNLLNQIDMSSHLNNQVFFQSQMHSEVSQDNDGSLIHQLETMLETQNKNSQLNLELNKEIRSLQDQNKRLRIGLFMAILVIVANLVHRIINKSIQ